MMIKRLTRNMVWVGLFLLLTSQKAGPPLIDTGTLQWEFRDLKSLYTFFERSVFYLTSSAEDSELLSLYAEIEDYYQEKTDLVTSALNLTKDAKGIFNALDTLEEKLQVFGIEKVGEKYVRKSIASFLNEVDPLMGTNLSEEVLAENLHMETIYQILKREVLKSKATLEKFKTDLADGRLNLVDYLPENLRKSFEQDKQKLKQNIQETETKLHVDYVNYMLILRKLKPVFKELLSIERIDAEFKKELIKAYVKIVSEDYLIDILVAFVSDPENDVILQTLLKSQEEARKIRNMVAEWKKYKSMPSVLRQKLDTAPEDYHNSLVLYKRSINQTYFDLRAELVDGVQDLLKGTLKKLKDDLGDNLKEQIEDSKLAEEARKYVKNESKYSLTDRSFVDIKNKPNAKAWLRMKIPQETTDQLNNSVVAEKVRGEFYLVFKPVTNVPDDLKVQTDGFVLKNDEQGIPKIDKDDVRNAMKDLFVEMPLGLTVSNIKLEKILTGNKINLVTYLNDQSTFQPLKFSLEERGMWARFGIDRTKVIAFQERLNLPKGLSLNITDMALEVDANGNVDCAFTLSWRLPETLGQLVSESLSTKDNEIKLKLSEIESLSLNEDNIKRAIRNRVVGDIVEKLQANSNVIKEALNQNLPVGTFSSLSFSQYESNVRGKFDVLPFGADLLEINDPIPVQFEVSFLNGLPRLAVITPTLDSLEIEKRTRAKLEEYLSSLNFVQQGEQTLRNLMDGLNINEVRWSPLAKGLCFDMDFQFYEIGPTPFNFCIGSDAEPFEVLKGKFQAMLLDNAEALAKSYLDEMVADIDCTGSLPDSVNIFGLLLTVDKSNSSCDRVEASLSINGANSIKVVLERNGTDMVLKEFNASQLINQVSTSVEASLNQLGVLQFSNTTYKNQRISMDITIDLRNFGLTLVEDLGTMEIGMDGKIYLDKINHPLFTNFNGYLKDISSAMVQSLAAVIQASINEHIGKNPEDYSLSFASQKVQLTRVEFDLTNRQMRIYSDFLLNNGDIPVPTIMTFSLSPLRLIRLELNGDVRDLLYNGINAGANYLAGLICGPCLTIDEFQFDANDWYKPVAITGTLTLDIPNLFSLPALKFQLSKDGLDFDVKPRIPFPAPIPIGTSGFALVYTFADIGLEERELTLGTSLTMGAGAEAYETAKVGRFDMTATINFNELTRIDFTGDLIIANMPLVYGGGFLDMKETEFEFYQKTPLFLKDLINYNSLIRVSGREKRAIGNAFIDILGVQANLEADIKIEGEYAELKAKGMIDLPLSEFSGSLKTKFIPLLPQSYILTSEASLYGGFEVGDFEIASAEINASIHRADIRFSFLDARLSASVPVLDAIDEDLILDLLFGMFDFDPEMLVDFLKNLDKTKISLKNIDLSLGTPEFYIGDGIGFGNGGDDDGFTGGEKGGGGSKMSTEEGIDNSLNGGLPSDHSPFIYKSDKVDTHIFETHKKCRKFKLGPFKVSWDCHKYRVRKDVFKPGSWPNYFKTLPKNFRSYHAIHDNKNDSKTGKRMYDLYSGIVHSFIKGYGTDFFLRTPLELEQRQIDNKYYLCASKEGFVGGESQKYCIQLKSQLSQETLNQVKLFGNITYGSSNTPLKIWTSVGFHPEDGVNYLTNPDSTSVDVDRSLLSASGEYGYITFEDYQFIPFDPQSQYEPQKIQLNGAPLKVYEVMKKREKKWLQGKKKAERLDSIYIFDLGNENIPSVQDTLPGLFDVILSQYAANFEDRTTKEFEPQGRDTILVIDDFKVFQNYAKRFMVDPDYDLNTQLVVLDSGIIAFDRKSKIKHTKARDNSTSPLGQLRQAVYDLSNKILITVPVNQQQPLVAILNNKFPNGGNNAISLLNTLKSNQSDFPAVANALMEYVQNWVSFGRSAELLLVDKKNADDFSFSAWNTSSTIKEEDWEFTYVVRSDQSQFEYNKVKLMNSDLTKALNLFPAKIDQHEGWMDQTRHVYYDLIQSEFKKSLEGKVLLSAKNDSIVYANMEQNNKFSISILTGDGLKERDSSQVYLINDNIRGNQNYYPDQFKDHENFFSKVTSEVAYSLNSRAYVKKVSMNGAYVFMCVVYNGDKIKVFWDRPSPNGDLLEFKLTPLEYDRLLGEVRNNRDALSERLARNIDQQSEEEVIAEFIFSGLEGFNYWRRYKSNKVNPLAILRSN